MNILFRFCRLFTASLLVSGLVLVIASYVSLAATNQVMLINVQTGKSLTIAGGVSTENNVTALQFTCDSHPSRNSTVMVIRHVPGTLGQQPYWMSERQNAWP